MKTKKVNTYQENPYQAVSVQKEILPKIKSHIKTYKPTYASISHFMRIAIENKITEDEKTLKIKH